jgi:hypothetical protein
MAQIHTKVLKYTLKIKVIRVLGFGTVFCKPIIERVEYSSGDTK